METFTMRREHADAIVAHARACLPEEACGLFAGQPGVAERAYCLTNADHSPSTYTIDAREQFTTWREAERDGLELVGCWHSHTHTEAYPSPTDVAQAFEPGWVYVLVSLRDPEPRVRGYRIASGKVSDVEIVVQ